MNKRHYRIQKRIVNRSISLVVVGLIIMVMLVAGRIAQEERSGYLISMQQQMKIVQDTITNFYERIDQDIHMIAMKPSIMEAAGQIKSYKDEPKPTFIRPSQNSRVEAEIYNIFKEYGESYPCTKYIYFATEDGGYTEWPEVTMPANYNPTQREWYQLAVAGKGEVVRTAPYIDTTNNMIISSAKAVYNDKNELIGVIGIDVKQTVISSMLANMKIGNTGSFMLVHKTGMIMADGNNPENNFKYLADVGINGLSDALNEDLNEYIVRIDDEEYVANSKSLVKDEWIVISLISKKELNANATQVTKIFMIISIVMITIISTYMMVSIRKIILTANLEEISSNTEQLAISMEETAVMIEQMSAVAKEMQKNINIIADSSQSSNKTVEVYMNTLQENAQTMAQKTVEKLNEVDKATEAVDKINHLCSAIKEIVEQTKLFATNIEKETTKVELTRLENTGVAQELNILIERSKEIVGVIQDITSRVTKTVDELSLNTNGLLKFVSHHTATNYARDIQAVQCIVNDYSRITNELINAMNGIIQSIEVLYDSQMQSGDYNEESNNRF